MDQIPESADVIGAGVRRAPIPDWVVLEDYETLSEPDADYVAQGQCRLMEEDQIDLTGPERAWFLRRADLVVAGAGAETASQFSAVFEPSCQRVEIHRIWIRRGGQTIAHENADGFEIMRRERNLEQRIFDGRMTVHFAIPDVRPGDVVEIAYTLYGERPSVAGRHALWRPFQAFGLGVLDTRHRLLAPQDRIIKTKATNQAPAPVEIECEGLVDRRWRGRNVLSAKYEPLAPAWVSQLSEVQFSEWRDWREVREAFAPGYQAETETPEGLEEAIQEIATQDLPPRERFMAALRLVQATVRYLAVAIGDGGLVPRSLAEIWSTRYGDCKDKCKLLSFIARRLDLDVAPTLVNDRAGHGIDAWLPTAFAFNHCIVRFRCDGATYWFDPTFPPQNSPIDKAQQCHLGWALALDNEADDLEWMAEPEVETLIDCRERVTIGVSPYTPVRYEWRITHQRGRAEMVRELLQREGEANVFKAYARDVQARWPKAAPLRQEVLEDNLENNSITLIEVYEIEDAWTQESVQCHFSTLDLVMRRTLAPIPHGDVRHPIFLGAIGRSLRRVEIESVKPLSVFGWRREGETDAFEFSNELTVETSKFFVLTECVAVKQRTLPPEKAQNYRDIVAELARSDLTLELTELRGEFVASKKRSSPGIGTYILIGWLVLALLGAISGGLSGG